MSGAAHSGPESDVGLLAAHVAGDPDAFGVLFRRHRDRLWAVALRTTGDAEEAADALQDAMISAFRRAETFRADSSVTTWLHRIVVNACLDRRRRRMVRLADPLPEAEAAPPPREQTGQPTDDPVAAAERAELGRRVLQALAVLPVEQRAALVLVDMQGFSVEEAAAVLEVPAGTVKSRCARGRARLAPLLAPLVEEPTGNRGVAPRVSPESRKRPGGGRP